MVQDAAWPDKLSNLEKSWRMPLDKGYSGPIVSKDRVWVAETRQAKDEVVRCLDRATGKQRWETSWPGSMTVPFFARANGSWIRSTPAYDGESLYVAGMRDVLVCLDAATGKERWRVDFMERFKSPLPAFGFVSSPLVEGDAVYVQAGASLVKLNKKTGETLWRTLKDEGGMYGSAFSSPTFATLAGKRQLLVQTRTTLAGVEPEDGSVLWGQKNSRHARHEHSHSHGLWRGCFHLGLRGQNVPVHHQSRLDRLAQNESCRGLEPRHGGLYVQPGGDRQACLFASA
jgi:outer membrane protein assembly factor BamB